MATHADVDLSTVLMEIFSDLKARCAASHDQYGPGGNSPALRYPLEWSWRMSFGTSELNGGMTPFSRYPVAMTTLLASMAPAFVRSK